MSGSFSSQPSLSEFAADKDLTIFFNVLRFISANGVQPPAPEAPKTPPPETILREDQRTGVSRSVVNRVPIPEEVETPLELFRMTATNLPIDTALLATQRQQLKTVLLAHYGEKKKTEVEQLFEENNGTNNHETKNKNSSTGMQSMQEIIPGLYCGSYHPAADKATLEAAGITHILCCIGTSPRFPDSFSYLTIATDDRPDFNIEPFFARTFEFIENALVKEHKKVLVHCGAGISRAPSVVCAYLIRKLRLPAVEAIALIRRKRPFASPNTGFTKQLKSYATSLGIAASKDKVAEALKEKEGREAALKACMEE